MLLSVFERNIFCADYHAQYANRNHGRYLWTCDWESWGKRNKNQTKLYEWHGGHCWKAWQYLGGQSLLLRRQARRERNAGSRRVGGYNQQGNNHDTTQYRDNGPGDEQENGKAAHHSRRLHQSPTSFRSLNEVLNKVERAAVEQPHGWNEARSRV